MIATTGLKPATAYTINTGTVAVTHSTPIAVGVRSVRVVVSTPTWFSIGPSPTATATASLYLPANAPEYFQCSGAGNEQVSALEVSSAGFVSITEMTQ